MKRLAFVMAFMVCLFNTSKNSFATDIPLPKPKIYCREKDKWMTPEEYSRDCKKSAPTSSALRGIPASEQAKLQMLKGMLQPIFNSLFNFSNLFGSPDLVRKDVVERKEEEKSKAIEAWNKHLKEAEEQAMKEAINKKRAGEEILAEVGIGSKPLATFTLLNSETSEKETAFGPIDWDNPRPTPISPGVSQVYTDSAKERLLKTAYFSKMAEVAMLNGDLEAARFWATVAFEGTSVSPRHIPYKPPKELIDAMDTRKAMEMNKKLTQYSNFFREALPKFDLLQGILLKVNEVKMQKEEYEKKMKEVEGQIKKLESQKSVVEKPEEKERINDLLSRAIAVKEEAEAEHRKAIQEEQKLLKEKQALEKDLNELKERFIAEAR